MNARLALKVAVSTAILGFLFWKTPVADVAATLLTADAGPILASVAISFLAWGLSAVRLWVLLPEYSFRRILGNTFIGLYYGVLLPGQVAGDLVKAYNLSKSQTTPGRAVAATALDRVIGVFALLALGALAAFFIPTLSSPARIGLAMIALGALAAVGLLLSKHFLGALDRVIRSRPILAKLPLASRFITGLMSITASTRELVTNLLIAVGFHALCVALQVVTGTALAIQLPIEVWCFVYAAVSVIVLLPVSIAGLGLREGGYIGLLGLFGIPADKALSLSLVFFAYSLLGALAGWVIDLTAGGKTDATRGH